MTATWLEDRSRSAPDGLRTRMVQEFEDGAQLEAGAGDATVGALTAATKAALARAFRTWRLKGLTT